MTAGATPGMQRLVLWDIDGTILHGGKLWKECFEESLRACYESGFAGTAKTGPWPGMPKISFSGKTDRQICQELLSGLHLWPQGLKHGDEAQLEQRIDSILRGYLDRAQVRVPGRAHEVKIMPGVLTLLDRLEQNPHVTQGLLTGNVREGARLKLESVGIAWDRFKMGVFGDDHWDRYQLPALAHRRSRNDHDLVLSGKQLVIIGDTIHDIGCGQEVGARIVAVGTGHGESRERVYAAWKGTTPGDPRPDSYFEDLSDTESVLSAILG